MKKTTISLVFILAAMHVTGHGRWIVPSHSILSGDSSEIVTFDISISNDVFFADNSYGGITLEQLNNAINNKPAQLKSWSKLLLVSPNGEKDDSTLVVDFGRKSVSAFEFKLSGTYRAEVTNKPIHFISYKDKFGKFGRIFGQLTANRNKVPSGATNISGTKLNSRVQTFITRNQISTKVLEAQGTGLELDFETHPNDLFASETFSVNLLFNGKAAPIGTTIKVTRQGTRHRNTRLTQKYKTDKEGSIVIQWAKPGMYLLEAELALAKKHKDYSTEVFSLYVTLEVSVD